MNKSSNYSHPASAPSRDCLRAIRRTQVSPSKILMTVNIARQQMHLFQRDHGLGGLNYAFSCRFRVSTARLGFGQIKNSRQTPLGLHRIAKKVGGGYPIGTVFKSRKPIGLTWNGLPDGGIVHRILWLEGLEPGFNLGGTVDTFERYIYVHGFSDETTLGRPQSEGCIHLAAKDLMPLYDVAAVGTLVWIEKGS
jgi:hypothetical protein